MRNYIDGGEAIVESFRRLNIDYVIASPGSEWGSVWEAFARQKADKADGPIYLSCAHENLAVNLAMGYTAMTGRMQAVMLHTGVTTFHIHGLVISVIWHIQRHITGTSLQRLG